MRFTLSLHDYIDQYLRNVDDGDRHCPVCYEQHLTHDKSTDMQGFMKCYKEQIIELKIYDHVMQTGEIPALDDQFADDIIKQIEQEMSAYAQQRHH